MTAGATACAGAAFARIEADNARIHALLAHRPGQLLEELRRCPPLARPSIAVAVLSHVVAALARDDASPALIERLHQAALAAYRHPSPPTPES